MKRRAMGVIASVVLAVLATAVLIAYVRGARANAAAGIPTDQVYVAKTVIPKGTKAADLTGKVVEKAIPRDVVAAGAVMDLTKLQGKVTGVDVQPGEQLIANRFVSPEQAAGNDIPPGLQEVTVSLEPERAIGGQVRPGDTVGVIASFAPFDFTNTANTPNGIGVNQKTPNVSHLILHKVRVTHVQMDKVPAPAKLSSADGQTTTTTAVATASPAGNILVTLAVDAPSAEQIVFAAEWGKLWLTNEPASANEGGSKIVTWGSAIQ